MVAFIALLIACASAGPGREESCPRGADYLATVEGLRGACAVSFVGDDLLVAVPESLGASRAAGMQVAHLAGIVPSLARLVPGEDGAGRSATGSIVLPKSADWADIAGLRLEAVVDVDSDGAGRIAVADAGGAVFVRGVQAAAWREFGRGVLERPSGVAWHEGSLFVSDERLRAVVVFDVDGREQARLGADSCGAPAGLDVGRDGTVFVADRLGDCVWRFAPVRPEDSGASRWSRGERLGESGSNPGQFSTPRDVAVVRRGDAECLAVADELNHRVQVLDAQGAFVGYFGMHALLPRQGEGRIHYPSSLAVAADGVTLAVAEPFEDRVQLLRLKADADPVDPSAFGGSFISSHFGSEIGCDDDILVLVDREIEAIAVCDARDPVPTHMCVVGGGGALPMRFGEISAIAVVPGGSPLGAGDIWAADRVHGRIDVLRLEWDRSKQAVFDQFLPRLARSMDLAKAIHRVSLPEGRAGWRTPEAVDIAFEGSDAYILDRMNRVVLRTDARLAAGQALALPADAREPEELAVLGGRIAVADPVARAVFVRSADGDWATLRALGAVSFVRPTGVAFRRDGASAGKLVVSDAALDALVVEESDGGARMLGERGVLDEQFWDPQGIAHSPRGLIVIDRGNHRYERFGDGLAWNLTGTLGRFYDRKRRGSPGAPPLDAPASTPDSRRDANSAATTAPGPKDDA